MSSQQTTESKEEKAIDAKLMQGGRNGNTGTEDIYKALSDQHYDNVNRLELNPRQFSNLPKDFFVKGTDVSVMPKFENGHVVQGTIGNIRLTGAPIALAFSGINNGIKYEKMTISLFGNALKVMKQELVNTGLNPDNIDHILYIKINHIHVKVFPKSVRKPKRPSSVVLRLDQLNNKDLSIKLKG